MFGTKWPSMMSIWQTCRAQLGQSDLIGQMRKFAARMEKAAQSQ